MINTERDAYESSDWMSTHKNPKGTKYQIQTHRSISPQQLSLCFLYPQWLKETRSIWSQIFMWPLLQLRGESQQST